MSGVVTAAELTVQQKRALAGRLLRERATSRGSGPILVHRMFEEQACRSPEAIAVQAAGRTATYRDLNARANRLARRLQAMGVGPEVLVGHCVDRSVEMVVGLLGILKAGGEYVPLDPSHPSQRLEYMLRDSGVGVLLTEEAIGKVLPCQDMKVLCLDSQETAFDQESNENLAESPVTANLAYVIYTSGSTGRPKGVEVPHRALGCFLARDEARAWARRGRLPSSPSPASRSTSPGSSCACRSRWARGWRSRAGRSPPTARPAAGSTNAPGPR